MSGGINEINTYYGRCRCCLSYGYLKSMWEEHYWEGVKEIYVQMLVQCFCLDLEHTDDSVQSDRICETCIRKLRDAHNFKLTVLKSQMYILKKIEDEPGIKTENPGSSLECKYEIESEELVDEDLDNADYLDVDEEDIDSDDVNEMEYEDVEYLEDDDDEPLIELQSPKVERRKKQPLPPSDRKWPKKLPKSERYKTYKQYSEEDFRACMAAVRNEEMTPKEAAKKYNIPKKTIAAKLRMEPKDAQGTSQKKQDGKVNSREIILKFKDNARNILENSNATPIKGRWGIGYGCLCCSYQNPSPAELKIHTLNKHNNILEEFKIISHMDLIMKLDITGLQCKLCGENFILLDKFTTHLEFWHDIKLHTDIKEQIIPFKFDTEELCCALCAKPFEYFKHLIEHMNVHYRNYECDICGRGFINKRALKTHQFRHKTGVFYCSFCAKVFNTRVKMKEHERVLHKNSSKTRKCGYCDERFIDPVWKIYHEVSVHGAPKPSYECKACGNTYDTKRALKTHTNQYHLLLKPHKCTECGKEFHFLNELTRHKVKHTGLREFQCEICQKWYKSRKTLSAHMKIHLNDKKVHAKSASKRLSKNLNGS